VGSVTVIITVVAVYLAYTANQGLPFVPTYDISVTVPDASAIAAGREVRVAGKRVGVIGKVEAVPGSEDTPVARLELELERALAPIRSDTVVRVRPLSPLGSKYLELEPGGRGRPLEEGESLSLANARPTVDITDSFELFDTRTRRSLQSVYRELGTGLAGRGTGINELVAGLGPLLGDAEDVGHELSRPSTRLERFIHGAERTATELRAADLGTLVEDADTTAGALDRARSELADSIGQTPATETAGIAALRAARPALQDAEGLLHDLRPGLRVLGPASRELHAAAVVGVPALRDLATLGPPLADTFTSLDRLARDPATSETLTKLGLTVGSLRPTVRFIAPAQTVCNYLGLAGRNFSSAISEGDASGTWLRTLLIERRSPEQLPSATPVDGLHVNPYAATGQSGECEAGNEPFLPGTRIGPVPGDQGRTEPTAPPEGVPAP
jgi:virulence factor Mce-like protein